MAPKKIDIEKISDFIINFCNEQGVSISPLKLQKLLYYVQAWHLVYFNQNPLFEDVPEAWVNGPVYRVIYKKHKRTDIYNDIHLRRSSDTNTMLNELILSKEQKDYLVSVLKNYAFMSHDRLVFLTHSEKPWNEARAGVGDFEYSENKISHELIYKYYKDLIDKENSKK